MGTGNQTMSNPAGEHDQESSITAQTVLEFWFCDESTGRLDLPQSKRWFMGGEALDAELRERFSEAVERARSGHLDHWLTSPSGALALIVLLDQFNRNIHRGTAAAFAADAKALTACHHALAMHYTDALPLTQRMFCYLPLEHAESAESQVLSLALFEELARVAPDELQEFAAGLVQYAREHKEIIDRFGRYPYRNEVLGRQSTQQELDWLQLENKRFGQ